MGRENERERERKAAIRIQSMVPSKDFVDVKRYLSSYAT
jgi:hypothetical protein